jgi:opacity protein-like surface antigen
MTRQIARFFAILFVLFVGNSLNPDSTVAQVRSRWSLELSGGLNSPVGNYDTRTYPEFGGAGADFSIIVRGSYRLSNGTSLEIGYGRARFGSDMADTLDRTEFREDPAAYKANGTVHTLQPTLRLEFLDGSGRIDPFVRLGLVVAWGRFDIEHLTKYSMLRPGEHEVDLDADTRTGGGVTIGAGTDFRISHSISGIVQGQYLHVFDTEILYFGESAHVSDMGDHFKMTWFDFSAGLRFSF